MFTVRSTEQPGKQRGIVTIMMAIALISILMMAGLAFGVSQVSLDRTRLQNVLDATALGAARVLNLTGNEVSATTAASELFGEQTDASALGNGDFTGASFDLEFSQPNSLGVNTFVRVYLDSAHLVTNPAMGLFGPGTSLPVNTTAMAGPSAVLTTANVVPILVCGNPAPPAGTFWGFTIDALIALTVPAPGTLLYPPIIPATNYVQILPPSPLGGDLAGMIAGAYDGNIAIGDVPITIAGAGVNANAVFNGINTRFGQYAGTVAGMGAIYPPDLVLTPGPYAAYHAAYNLPFIAAGAPERRVLVVPIGDCTGLSDGANNAVPILGLGCFLLEAPLLPLPPLPPPSPPIAIAGYFIANCNGKGTPGDGANPATPTIGPTQIILYGDPDPTQWGS